MSDQESIWRFTSREIVSYSTIKGVPGPQSQVSLSGKLGCIQQNEKKSVPWVAVLAGSRGPRNSCLARGADHSRHRRRFRLGLLPRVILIQNRRAHFLFTQAGSLSVFALTIL